MHLPGFGKKGFTLVELMVVISVIAILTVIGVVIYQGQQKNARDARRKSDIKAIVNAMEAGKPPGQINYNVLKDDMFTSGKVPVDPADSNIEPDNSCPGVCKYCVRSEIGNCAITDPPVGAGSPGAVATWVVCANLEAGGSFCQSNAQ